MMRNLERLLRPKSIAVFGGREAERVVRECDRAGFSGEIWTVHPSREEMGGRRCFRSVDDLPAVPDAAFIGVNRERTVEIVGALSERGAGGAICYASGFREAESGAALQQALVLEEGGGDLRGARLRLVARGRHKSDRQAAALHRYVESDV